MTSTLTGSLVPVPYNGNREPVEPDRFPEPVGTSGNREPVTVPIVLISSRDGASVPHIPRAGQLVALAQRSGWRAAATYALADVPGLAYADPRRGGEEKRPAHLLHTVAVRLARGVLRGYAVWARVDDGPYRFDTARLSIGPALRLRELTERIKQG